MFKPATSMLALLVLFAFCRGGDVYAQLPGDLQDNELPQLDLPTPFEEPGSPDGGPTPLDTPSQPDNGLPPLPEPADSILNGSPAEEPSARPEVDGAGDADQSNVQQHPQQQIRSEPGETYEGFPVDEPICQYLAPVYSSGDWLNCCNWYGELDFILMHRTVGQGRELGEDQSIDTNPLTPTADFRPIVTDDAGFRITPGGRIRVGRFLGRDSFNRDASVEVAALGLFDWETGISLASLLPQNVFSALDPTGGLLGGFNRADFQQFTYSADLRTIEANIRLQHRLGRDRMVAMPDGTWTRQLASGFTPSYFLGFRYLGAQENLDWISRRVDVDPTVFGGDYNIETRNELVGTHIGGEFRWISKSINLAARGKAGGFVNFADMQRTIRTADPLAADPNTNVRLINFSGTQGDEVMAVILEMGFLAAYQFNPNVAIRASYDMMWINGLAVAPQQLTFEPSRSRISLGGNVFYQGLSTGIEIVW